MSFIYIIFYVVFYVIVYKRNMKSFSNTLRVIKRKIKKREDGDGLPSHYLSKDWKEERESFEERFPKVLEWLRI